MCKYLLILLKGQKPYVALIKDVRESLYKQTYPVPYMKVKSCSVPRLFSAYDN